MTSQEPAKVKPKHATVGTKFTGEISVSGKGVGYFNDDSLIDDLEIQPERIHTALHGDTVEIVVVRDPKNTRRPQAEVTRIVERAKMTFVGEILQGRTNPNFIFLMPDDRRMYAPIRIVSGVKGSPTPADAVPGTKAQVTIISWKEDQAPEGEVVRIIGKKGNNNVEMHSIVLEKGFEPDFPPDVEAEAERIEREEIPVPQAEIAKRRDFRQTLTMTIDPVDAKDFDDALSIKELPNGHYEIGVHIADVSHYVRPGTALDREAVKRGCSVYLVDRTIPMLPEVLSNGICSLNPNADRLTFSAVFEMDTNGTIYTRWFGKTIIHSARRFTYEDAQERIVSGTGDYAKELLILNGIAKRLSSERFRNGSIDFEKDEVKFQLDADGKPIKVFRKSRFDAHKLVEDFMLLANREVAEYVFNVNKIKNLPEGGFIYRIHDRPDREKIVDLEIFIRALGFELEAHDGAVSSKAIRNLLDQVTGTPHETLIKTAAIRSMAKAIYSTKNVGHFGLAFKYYAHFTSPIRRYPDLLVQRVLQTYLENKAVPKDEFARYQNLAEKSTDREILAAEAERSSIKYKQVEYMQERIGQTFTGTVTGVTEWGMYIEENETKCEGMAKIRDIGTLYGDFFALDEKTYSIFGEKTKKTFRLGDTVTFKVMGADLEKKVLDYALTK